VGVKKHSSKIEVLRRMSAGLINYTCITLTLHRDEQVRVAEFYDVAMTTTRQDHTSCVLHSYRLIAHRRIAQALVDRARYGWPKLE